MLSGVLMSCYTELDSAQRSGFLCQKVNISGADEGTGGQ